MEKHTVCLSMLRAESSTFRCLKNEIDRLLMRPHWFSVVGFTAPETQQKKKLFICSKANGFYSSFSSFSFYLADCVWLSRSSAPTGKKRSQSGTSSGHQWSLGISGSTLALGSTAEASVWGWRSLVVLCQVTGLYRDSGYFKKKKCVGQKVLRCNNF